MRLAGIVFISPYFIDSIEIVLLNLIIFAFKYHAEIEFAFNFTKNLSIPVSQPMSPLFSHVQGKSASPRGVLQGAASIVTLNLVAQASSINQQRSTSQRNGFLYIRTCVVHDESIKRKIKCFVDAMVTTFNLDLTRGMCTEPGTIFKCGSVPN